MGLYNFKKRFVPFILDGRKKHTIRAKRKHRAKVGETLHLYTGLRTKHTTLLMRAPCVRVDDINIISGCSCDAQCTCSAQILINDEQLTNDECEALAKADGFKSFAEMKSFWNGRELPFFGDLIHWSCPGSDSSPTIPANLQVAATSMEANS